MIGFLIKKAFFDGWDNLFSLLLLNVVFVLLLALGVLVPGIAGAPAWLGVAAALVAAAAASAWWGTCVFALRTVADFGSISFSSVLAALKDGALPGLQVGCIYAAAAYLLSIGVPFYLTKGGLLGTFAFGILFWCAVILLLSLQFYLPLRARLGGGLRKNLRKSFIIFFDNPGFSLFLFLYSAVSLVLSAFLAFLMPGFAGVALAGDVAIRLRMRKYDWLEEHPEARRRKLPWDELLAGDRELVGTRTLKGMIFPWKD